MFLSTNGRLIALRWNTEVGSDNASSLDSDTAVPVGTWTHVAATFDATTIKVYINGVEVGIKAFAFPLVDSAFDPAFPMLIGTDTTNNRWFDGLIDEVSLYNRALTGAEILAIFNAGSAGKVRP